MNRSLLLPVDDGFRQIGVGRTKGYWLVRQGRLTLIKIGRKSLLSQSELESLAAELLNEAKQAG